MHTSLHHDHFIYRSKLHCTSFPINDYPICKQNPSFVLTKYCFRIELTFQSVFRRNSPNQRKLDTENVFQFLSGRSNCKQKIVSGHFVIFRLLRSVAVTLNRLKTIRYNTVCLLPPWNEVVLHLFFLPRVYLSGGKVRFGGSMREALPNTRALTFEIERLVPSRIQRAPFDFRLEPVFLVR